MRTIHKYRLAIADDQCLLLPEGFSPLAVEAQAVGSDLWVCLWAIVDTEAPMRSRLIFCAGTGHPLPDVPLAHLGTVQQPPFVWHFFDGGPA